MENNFDDLLAALQAYSAKHIQTKIEWTENIPNDIWNKYLKDQYKQVACNLFIDTHRWFELSTTVIKVYDRYLGIHHITNLFSESSSCSDIYYNIEFTEMKEKATVTYVPK